MTTNRRRNVFTLADSNPITTSLQQFRATLSRRKPVDLFERDPFKVQSYNFHYAERPTYPILNVQRQQLSTQTQTNGTKCENFFYNSDFPYDSRSLISQKLSVLNYNNYSNNKENRGTAGVSKFQENRRRNFLQENKQSSVSNRTRNTTVSQCETNCNNPRKETLRYSSLYPIRSSCSDFGTKTETKYLNSSSGRCSSPRNRNTSTFKSNSASVTDMFNNKKQLRETSSVRSLINNEKRNTSKKVNCLNISGSESARFCIESKRSLSSGCEININIKPLISNAKGENVTIKIETDAVIKNFDIRKPKRSISLINTNINSVMSPALPKSPGLTLLNKRNETTSKTFVIDKHISKYSIINRECNQRQGGSYELERKCTFDKIQQQQPQQQQQQHEHNKSHACEKRCQEPLAYIYKPTAMTKTTTTAPTRICNPRVIPSTERLPSLVPWKMNNTNDCSNTKNTKSTNTTSPPSPTPRKSLIQRVSDNMKCTSIGSINTLASLERPTSSLSCCYNKESKILNSVANATENPSYLTKTFAKSSLASICGLSKTKPLISYLQPINVKPKNSSAMDYSSGATTTRPQLKPIAPLVYHTNSKIPLSLNINVCPEKMKKLRV